MLRLIRAVRLVKAQVKNFCLATYFLYLGFFGPSIPRCSLEGDTEIVQNPPFTDNTNFFY